MSEDRLDGNLKKGVGRVQDSVGGSTGDGRTQDEGKLNLAVGSIQDSYGKALGQAQDAAADFKTKTQDWYGQLESFVEEQPVFALATAVGLGVVVGMVIRGGQKTV